MEFERETEAALGLRERVQSYAVLPTGDGMKRGRFMGRFAASRSPMSSTRIDGARFTGICSGHEHPASFPRRLAAHLPASVIVVFDPEGGTGCKSLPIAKFASSL
jgi:hypothetical protein